MKKILCIISAVLCIFLTSCGDATSIGIICGADGPTAILVSEKGEIRTLVPVKATAFRAPRQSF